MSLHYGCVNYGFLIPCNIYFGIFISLLFNTCLILAFYAPHVISQINNNNRNNNNNNNDDNKSIIIIIIIMIMIIVIITIIIIIIQYIFWTNLVSKPQSALFRMKLSI